MANFWQTFKIRRKNEAHFWKKNSNFKTKRVTKMKLYRNG